MRFRIVGSFEAESVDDAFLRLGDHFLALAAGVEFPGEPSMSGPYVLIVEPEPEPADE